MNISHDSITTTTQFPSLYPLHTLSKVRARTGIPAMPPKHRGPSTPAAAPASAHASHTTSSAASTPARSSTSSKQLNASTAQEIVQGVWDKYVQKTPQRVKLLDCFMAFLVAVGVLQFVYCVIAGNFVSYMSLYVLLFRHIWRLGRRREGKRRTGEGPAKRFRWRLSKNDC